MFLPLGQNQEQYFFKLSHLFFAGVHFFLILLLYIRSLHYKKNKVNAKTFDSFLLFCITCFERKIL